MTIPSLIQRTQIWSGHISAFLLGSMFVAFILQVIFRYLLNLPIGWTVEWVTLSWLWGVLFTFAFVSNNNDMIRLDILYSLMPKNVARVMDVVTSLCCAAIFIVTLPKAWEYVDFMSIERTAYLRLPFNWVFALYIPFHVSVIIRMFAISWKAITHSQEAKHA
ncbi:TRAP transporter small permease [Marinomonas sp. IMCC 4694]|uniref:TRAP transporter small permease n=1 Tax=Marinomonas sp. IMCC 4694 TaxID=2605432 RepID=UPI001CA327A9|nr:TRAP transporter small permease subunit [Marinomonas sp. IMCC 4694]